MTNTQHRDNLNKLDLFNNGNAVIDTTIFKNRTMNQLKKDFKDINLRPKDKKRSSLLKYYNIVNDPNVLFNELTKRSTLTELLLIVNAKKDKLILRPPKVYIEMKNDKLYLRVKIDQKLKFTGKTPINWFEYHKYLYNNHRTLYNLLKINFYNELVQTSNNINILIDGSYYTLNKSFISMKGWTIFKVINKAFEYIRRVQCKYLNEYILKDEAVNLFYDLLTDYIDIDEFNEQYDFLFNVIEHHKNPTEIRYLIDGFYFYENDRKH